jgi:glycosyltransferase involved in cell wall biosynthesis
MGGPMQGPNLIAEADDHREKAPFIDRPSIVFMITSLSLGGAPKQMTEVAVRLSRRGWNVAGVVSLVRPEAGVDYLKRHGVPVFSLDMSPGFGNPLALVRAIRLLRKLQPDILISFLFHASALGWLAAKAARVCAVVSSIRSESLGHAYRDLLCRFCGGFGHINIVNSARAARSLVARKIVRPARYYVVPNGIDVVTDIRNVAWMSRQTLQIPPEAFVWFAAGWLYPEKDYPTLLRAFATLRESAYLLIAGRGPLDGALRRTCAELGIEARVSFLGLRDDVPNLLSACDAFVSSSVREGMPNAIMEAMAARKPVVATDVGGVGELIRDNVTGFLVPPKRPCELATAMRRVMSMTADARRQLGEVGRRVVTQTHSWEHVVETWDRVLCAVLKEQQRRGATDHFRETSPISP